MKRFSILLQGLMILAIILTTVMTPGSVSAAAKSGYQTGFKLWRGPAGDFSDWTLAGVMPASFNLPGSSSFGQVLVLDPATAQPGTDPYAPGTYYGHDFYNGGDFVVGEATSPVYETSFGFQEAIASWDAKTPDGTWIETLLSVRIGSHWSKFYNMGVWASGTGTVERHSVNGQRDADGTVYTDTFVAGKTKTLPDAFQLKVRLFSADGVAKPTVSSLSVAYSTSAEKVKTLQPGDPADWNTLLDVPECSQMVYTDGGNVWCSPTSTSMVLGYWMPDPGPCEPRVRAAVAGTYDWLYDGNGNWPFNTAYAASNGLEGYVARYSSLADLEPWIKAGVPVVMSIAWGKKDLTGAPIPSSSGHLIVLVGFDTDGNPIVNDPAAGSNDTVQRTYLRSELETIWLEQSGGTVYLIFPAGWSTPGL